MSRLSNFLLILIILPQFVDACMYPNQGEEYNALIKIEKLDSKYKLSLPRIVGDSSGWPTLTLIYSSHELENNCKEEILPDGTQLICFPKETIREELILNSYWGKTLDWISNKKLYEGEFQIKDKANYSVAISAMWETSACLTFGHKVVIE